MPDEWREKNGGNITVAAALVTNPIVTLGLVDLLLWIVCCWRGCGRMYFCNLSHKVPWIDHGYIVSLNMKPLVLTVAK